MTKTRNNRAARWLTFIITLTATLLVTTATAQNTLPKQIKPQINYTGD